MTEQKSANIQVKATEDSGYFKAVVSVFNTVDSYSDVVMKGAFAKTLQEWEESGTNIPVLWSHDLNDPFAHIGELISAKETDEGLEVEGQLDLDNPTAKQAHKLIKGRRVKEWSFGYIVRDSEMGEKDGQQVRELKDVELLEVSLTLIGANRNTRTIDAKSAPEQSEEKTVAPVFTLADLDNAIAAIKAMSDATNETLSSLTKAREAFDTKSEEEEVVEEEVIEPEVEETEEVEEIDKQAAASESEIDEDSTESKSTEEETAAAKAQELEIKQALIELERMIQE